MEIPVHDLYVLKGEAGPWMERTKEALRWLLSPEAEGVGEKLLRDAHALHGKPVTIGCDPLLQTAYHNELGHLVNLNHAEFDLLKFKASDGSYYVPSLESVLAHELEHAGQVVPPELQNEIKALHAEVSTDTAIKHIEIVRAVMEHSARAVGSPYQASTNYHIAQTVDHSLALTKANEAAVSRHPVYAEYVKTYELPAVATERHVSALRGEPLRADYAGGSVDYDKLRTLSIKRGQLQTGVASKPLLLTSPPPKLREQPWAEYIQNGGTFKLASKEHPNIATHVDGGRTTF